MFKGGIACKVLESEAASTTHSPEGNTSCFLAPIRPTVNAAGPENRSPIANATVPLFAGWVK